MRNKRRNVRIELNNFDVPIDRNLFLARKSLRSSRMRIEAASYASNINNNLPAALFRKIISRDYYSRDRTGDQSDINHWPVKNAIPREAAR